MMPLTWRLLAVCSLLLALIGAILPIMPTVPFLLLSAWAASRGWPALEHWLLEHPIYGIHIHHWRQYGAVSRRAKWLATATMCGSVAITSFMPLPLWLKYALAFTLFAIGTWLWLRPERE